MSDISARLDLPLIKPSQAQKHVTHNEALEVLDGLVQAVLEDANVTTPPFEPADGSLYALGSGPVGEWADQGGNLAYRAGNGWVFMAPQEGWRAWDKTANAYKIFRSGNWTTMSVDLENLPGVGIGTTSDAINKLSVASNAVLLSHDGAGHQLKVNKAASGDTASLLFQSGFTGHAELGLTGDNAFSVKISGDGASWFDAIKADPTLAEVQIGFPVTGSAVQQNAEDDTTGRLLVTGAAATVLTGGLESRVAFGGTGDAIALTTQAGLTAIPVGYRVRFRATSSNTGPATINLDANGAAPCRTVTGAALPAGYLRTDTDTVAEFDGTNWVLDRQVERGSNANGDYTRYADGSQVVIGFPQLTYMNPLFLGVQYQFPAMFVASNKIIAGFTTENFSTTVQSYNTVAPPSCLSFTRAQCTVLQPKSSAAASYQPADTMTVRFVARGYWY